MDTLVSSNNYRVDILVESAYRASFLYRKNDDGNWVHRSVTIRDDNNRFQNYIENKVYNMGNDVKPSESDSKTVTDADNVFATTSVRRSAEKGTIKEAEKRR